MKKVLFITAFPPSDKSAAEKNTKRMLQEFGYDFNVDLVYFKDKYDEIFKPDSESIQVIRIISNSKKYRIINALKRLYFHPLFTVRYDENILRWVQSLVNSNSYCAIVFDHSQTFMYARKIKFDGIKILLSHDIEAQRVKRSSSLLQYKLCFCTEKYVLSTQGVSLFALSQKDVGLINDLYSLPATVVNIYIDRRIESNYPKRITDEYVLFGNWVRQDNYDGALWLLNGIGDYLISPAVFNIIGKNFPIEKVKKNEKVIIKNWGFVDNPYPFIAESRAMLCPLFSGAGIKVKVIESLACGTPAIGTDIAFEGFDNKFDAFMIRCDNLKSFAQSMNSISYELQERLAFKDFFIKEYTSTTIPNWLKKQLDVI